MAGVKLIVQYPPPKDVEAFEKAYHTEHVPMAVARLSGKTKIVASKVIASPQGPGFLSDCRDTLPVNGASGSICRIGRRQADNCQCCVDLFRRSKSFYDR
jgi:hypothetical protein